jgi:hypothetical protein
MEPMPAEPVFSRLLPSIVRSVRQSHLLDAWLDNSRRAGGLPQIDTFGALAAYPEPDELMTYEVVHRGSELKYLVRSEGAALVASFGFSGQGRFLDEVIAPNVWAFTAPIYRASVEERLPVYSVFSVFDNAGRRVFYERLLLPFGSEFDVTHLAAALKTTAWDGEFENENLMRPEGHDPEYVLRAIISTGGTP